MPPDPAINTRRRFLFVINPVAGTRSKTGLEQLIRSTVAAQGTDSQVCWTEKSTTPAALRARMAGEEITDAIACGGDGTVNLVAAAACGGPVRVGILPIGSGNGLARAAGLPLKSTEALAVALRGRAISTDAFQVDDRFGIMLAGMGLDAAVAASFAQAPRRGLVTYVQETCRQFIRARPHDFRLAIDGAEIVTRAYFVCVANGNQFGNNVKIAPRASLTDGLLDVVVVRDLAKPALPFALLRHLASSRPSARLDEHPAGRGVIYLRGREITVSNPGSAPLHIDGDPVQSAAQLKISSLPGTVNLLVP